MKRTLLLGIIFVVLLAFVGAVSANLVSNGGFDTAVPAFTGTFETLNAGSSVIAPWTVDSGSIDLVNSYWVPNSDPNSIDLAGNEPGKISQPISTDIGGTYELSFYMAGNPDQPGVKTLEIYWDGSQLTPSQTFDSTGHSLGAMGWTKITIPNLVATKTQTTISFENEAPNNAYGVALDDISVVRTDIPVPEFPTMALPAGLIIGLVGTVLFMQRSKEN